MSSRGDAYVLRDYKGCRYGWVRTRPCLPVRPPTSTFLCAPKTQCLSNDSLFMTMKISLRSWLRGSFPFPASPLSCNKNSTIEVLGRAILFQKYFSSYVLEEDILRVKEWSIHLLYVRCSTFVCWRHYHEVWLWPSGVNVFLNPKPYRGFLSRCLFPERIFQFPSCLDGGASEFSLCSLKIQIVCTQHMVCLEATR